MVRTLPKPILSALRPRSLAKVGMLLGDVDGNTKVENTDVNLVQAQVGKSVKLSNFRKGVNADGAITQKDVTITQNHVGTGF
jgi:hypothetical protein